MSTKETVVLGWRTTDYKLEADQDRKTVLGNKKNYDRGGGFFKTTLCSLSIASLPHQSQKLSEHQEDVQTLLHHLQSEKTKYTQ